MQISSSAKSSTQVEDRDAVDDGSHTAESARKMLSNSLRKMKLSVELGNRLSQLEAHTQVIEERLQDKDRGGGSEQEPRHDTWSPSFATAAAGAAQHG